MTKNRDIFSPSNSPIYDYPHLVDYGIAIIKAQWSPYHFTYDRSILDYKVTLSDKERDIVKKCMLAIGMIENKVKTFWARIDQRLPKTEISITGHTFAGNEVIHQLTYKMLLDMLGLTDEFNRILDVPQINGRVNYLNKYLEGLSSRSNKEFTKSLILFTMLIENTSLFAYFLTLSSFTRHSDVMKTFSDIILATSKEENIHAKFGEELIKIIKSENPDWFDEEMEAKIRRNIRKAFKAEIELLDWVFEKGELEFLPKASIQEYLKTRFNKSLNQLGYESEFEIDELLLEPTNYFDVMIYSTPSTDFFDRKITDYAKDTAFNEEDLW
jgi:ribonucleoside-diphosphate reductase beta chain